MEASPYWSLLDFRVLGYSPGYAKLLMPVTKRLLQPYGAAHGGALASLGDAAVAMALFTLVEPSDSIATAQLSINYLAPVGEEDVVAEARIVHRGSRTGVGEFELKNGDGRLVVKGLATYVITRQPS